MPRPKALYPSYRLHKRSGQAIVTLGDRMVYLGEYDTDESRAEGFLQNGSASQAVNAKNGHLYRSMVQRECPVSGSGLPACHLFAHRYSLG
jgi:hypothetical protein